MTLHLIKLCVGAGSVADLAAWQAARMAERRARAERALPVHVTRMTPKRAEELLDGGSLYWVIRGAVLVRQKLLAIEPFEDGEGIARCRLVLEPALMRTAPQPRRPFQGWRYLRPDDAPADAGRYRKGGKALPEALLRELGALGLA